MSNIVALVTRPIANSEKTAFELSELEIQSFIEPMLEIIPNDELKEGLIDENVRAIIVTSANAIEAIANIVPAKDIDIISVGESTSQIAINLGFKNVITMENNAQSIERYIVKNYNDKNGYFVYASADVVSRDITKNLELEGYFVKQIITYFSKEAEQFSQNMIGQLDQGNIKIALFYSARTAKVFCKLVEKHNLQDKLKNITAFCLSENITNSLQSLKFMEVKFCEDSKSDSLLELIKDFKLTIS